MASSWTDPLSPRPLWLEFLASEATQGELQVELLAIVPVTGTISSNSTFPVFIYFSLSLSHAGLCPVNPLMTI